MKIFNRYKRQISAFLILTFINQLVFPVATFALTGGPSQPEVQSFEPIGTTQMVDAFSGDFNYNIPLMEIDGYPINISYHSGITTDQEASWVGLGWNLNPGVVNRNMRGLPDDFDGDLIEKETELKPDATIAVNLGAGMELIGVPKKSRKKQQVSKFAKKLGASEVGLSINMGLNFNNYRGVGFDFGIIPSIGFDKGVKSNYSLALNYSSQGGATVSPKIGIASQTNNKSGYDLGGGIGGGFNINSRQGLKDINISTNASFNKTLTGANKHETQFSESLGMNFSSNSFASSSYTPQIKHGMNSYNVSFNFNLGVELKSVYLNFSTGGSYSKQAFGTNGRSIKSNKSYGSLYLENSIEAGDEVLLDFNREKDGAFSKENPTLGIPQNTFDLYSYSGQGIGGMFRTFRSDLPIFSDPENISISNSSNIGGDVGLGDLFKAGTSLTFNRSESRSGKWKGSKGNQVVNELGFGFKKKDIENNPLYEPSYFRNIGEKNMASINYLPYEFLNEIPKIDIITPYNNNSKIRSNLRVRGVQNMLTNNMPIKSQRPNRDKRNVYIKNRKGADAKFCLSPTISNISGFGLDGYTTSPINRVDGNRKSHHTTEISVINPDGNKYVYGIAAYNIEQKEYSFTYAKDIGGTTSPTIDCVNGMVQYNSSGITSSTGTRIFKGIDYYFDRTKTPAYAHSYLLTNILSNDYIDVTNDGVSKDDIGTYVNINYNRVHTNYKWRVPYEGNSANFNEGLKSDKFDDNANFVYGEKEIWHVHSIEGRNHIAVFYTSPRNDGLGVIGVDGGMDVNMKSYKLDSIKLFSQNDLINPIKSVYFEYDYSRCPGVPNNVNYNPSNLSDPNSGKLTLKKLYFTYGNSIKGKYNSYVFEYSSVNPSYNLKAYDRWGNYKPATINVGSDNASNGVCDNRSILLSKDYPYVEQNKETADQYSQAWTLNKIKLPSGGEIAITYEADDYAYVQDKIATQMYRLLGASDNLYNYTDKLYESENHNYLFFEVDESITDENVFKKKIIQDLKDLYFNVLVDLDNKGTTEYIRGYIKPLDAGLKTMNGKNVGWIKIDESDINDVGRVKVNAISLAGWNFTNLYLPQLIYPGSNTLKSELSNEGKVKEFAKSLYGFFPEMFTLIRGLNYKLRNKEYSKKFIPEKSWIKANNVTGYKYGGGCRVKRIVSIDKWKSMEGTNNVEDFEIGQEYNYEIKVGQDSEGNPIMISSGVASYEPMAGGDENPFRKPVYYDQKQTLVPDVTMYAEEPFGESYFPSPSVGYSRVSVKTISSATQEELTRNGSGKVVYEFYTTKDFPTIVQAPKVDIDEQNPNIIFSLVFKNIHKALTMTQGYQIILNDMNGKQKGQWNFDQKHINDYGVESAYSGVKYEYFEKFEGVRKLDNYIRVIKPDNTISIELIGVESDVVADSRQFTTENYSGGVNLNLDVFKVGLIPIPVPTGIPSYERETTDFQSGVIVRVINTYGILKSTTAYEEGATLRTENTLFDSETGEVVMTKTQNEFDDYIHSTTYPAHWVYDGMKGAYINDGMEINIVKSSSDDYSFKAKVSNVEYNPSTYFSQGDFIELSLNGTIIESGGIWVHKTDNGNWRLIDKTGNLISLSPSLTYKARVIATGRKNRASTPITSITSLKDHTINSNNKLQYNNSIQDSILTVSVNEFDQKWQKEGCYGFGIKRDTVKLIDDAVDIFNYLVEIGTISMGNAEEYIANSGGNYNYPYKKNYSISLPTSNSLFGKTEFHKIQNKLSINSPYNITSIQIRRQGANSLPGKTFGFNYDFGHFEGSVNNETIKCINNMIVVFHAFDSLELISLESKEISYIEIDQNQTPQFDGYQNYGSLNYPVYRFWGGVIVHFTDNTTKTGEVDINASYYREKTIYGLELETVNPYLTGLRNNWKSKRSWAYVSNRSPQNSSSNIRKDGYFADYQNFWTSNSNGWQKQSSLSNKWQFTKEVTKYSPSGAEIESKNPLNIYNSSILDQTTKLPIAVANNAKQNQIYFQGFEYSPYYYNNSTESKCPPSHSMIDPLSIYLDTLTSHSGVYSYKVSENTRLLKTYTTISTESQTSINGEYVTNPGDYNTPFIPTTGKYIISAWVKVGNAFSTTNYSNAKIRVVKSTSSTTINDEGTPSAGTYYDFVPSGPIIDGWQRIEGEFEINSNTQLMSIRLIPDPSQSTYFDDIRVYPLDAIMKSYVYESRQLKIWAELDENNYATFYEYDKGGNLIRVKKETEKGIMTLKDTRNSLKKAN
jgi:hypothetical protein